MRGRGAARGEGERASEIRLEIQMLFDLVFGGFE